MTHWTGWETKASGTGCRSIDRQFYNSDGSGDGVQEDDFDDMEVLFLVIRKSLLGPIHPGWPPLSSR